jgi:hypothetical protein
MHDDIWNDESVSELLALKARGLSMSAIAEAMGRTRNAVIGKLARIRNGSFRSGFQTGKRNPIKPLQPPPNESVRPEFKYPVPHWRRPGHKGGKRPAIGDTVAILGLLAFSRGELTELYANGIARVRWADAGWDGFEPKIPPLCHYDDLRIANGQSADQSL